MLDALRPTRIVGSDGEQHALPDGLGVEEGDALVVASSGTAGQPKGVVLTHEAVPGVGPRDDRRAWRSTRAATRGSPACRSPTSGASPS